MKTLTIAALSFLPVLAAAAPVEDGSCPSLVDSALSDLTGAVTAAASTAPAPASRLVFDAAFGERVDDALGGPGLLFAGATVQLAVSPERFKGCADGVTAYVKDASGAITTVAMDTPNGGLLTGNFVAPASGAVEVWFHASRPAVRDLPACEAWDSDFGRNYEFATRPYEPVRATFASGTGEPSFDGSVKKGGALVIDYDPARLPDCRPSYMGNPTWSIIAHVRFDDGGEVAKNVAGTIPTVGGPAAFAIPENAGSADVWFENVGYYPGNATPCRVYDSRNGANYRIAFSD